MEFDLDDFHRKAHANRWGGRTLLTTDNSFPAPSGPPSMSFQSAAPRSRAVLVDTPFFPRAYLWRLSFLFSLPNNAATITPVPLAFTPLAVAPIRITVRHGIDERQGTIDDVYNLTPTSLLGPTNGEGIITPCWMPLGVIASAKLTIITEVTGAPPNNQSFVDISATIIDAVDTESIVSGRGNTNIFGFPSTFPTRVAATAGPFVHALPANAARRKLYITNQSTSNLAVGLGFTPSLTVGSERYTVLLTPTGTDNSRWVSGLDECWGDVDLIWDGSPGVNDYAMIAETDLFG